MKRICKLKGFESEDYLLDKLISFLYCLKNHNLFAVKFVGKTFLCIRVGVNRVYNINDNKKKVFFCNQFIAYVGCLSKKISRKNQYLHSLVAFED